MNPKQLFIVGAIAVVITISLTVKDEENSTQAPSLPYEKTVAVQDEFHRALGVSSDEEVYEALYSGKSLAELAAANNMDAQHIIDLQAAQLSKQLDRRYAAGSLSEDAYAAHKAELAEMISKSVHST